MKRVAWILIIFGGIAGQCTVGCSARRGTGDLQAVVSGNFQYFAYTVRNGTAWFSSEGVMIGHVA
jgi:hypothetical protein